MEASEQGLERHSLVDKVTDAFCHPSNELRPRHTAHHGAFSNRGVVVI
jgi:hypothetical protein